MFIKTGIKQAFRTPRRLIAYFLVAAVVCAFLCVGLNLKKHAEDNLTAVINNFNVIAYPDFQAYITSNGSLAVDALVLDSVGYFSCWAENYDLEQLYALPGVQSIDARNQFGAYLRPSDGTFADWKYEYLSSSHPRSDVIIFEWTGDQPYTVTGYTLESDGKYHAKAQRLPVKRLWSAAGRGEDTITYRLGNGSWNSYVLEPGKQYIMKMGELITLNRDPFYNSKFIQVDQAGLFSIINTEGSSAYYSIYEYTEDFWDTEEGRYFMQTAETVRINENSLTVITTNDLAAIPSWNSNKVSLVGGRQFTQEEYDTGAKVCIVSKALADELGWSIGDTLDLSFYESVYTFGGKVSDHYSSFAPRLYHDQTDIQNGNVECTPMDHFFDKGTFEIIGFYGGEVSIFSNSYTDYEDGMDWQMVLIPSASVANQPEPKLSQYTTSIRLEPLKVQEFLAAAQASGLMDEQQFGYQLGLTVEDHGLSNLASGLESLDQISSLTLMLAIITAALAVAVLAILHLLQNKKQIASLRSMGVKRGQVAACILSGILLTCILGAAVGAFAGQMLSVTVTEKIMASAEQDTFDDTFSAMIATYHAYDEYEMTTTADPRLTILAGGSVALALTLFSVALVLHEGKKPPLLTLGVKE